MGKTTKKLDKAISKIRGVPYITKTKHDGFYSTGLLGILKKKSVSDIIFTGIYANSCVKLTAESALKRGFRIYTAKDIIGDTTESDKKEAMDWFAKNGILYGNYKDILRNFKKK